jgi:hypothetical protein
MCEAENRWYCRGKVRRGPGRTAATAHSSFEFCRLDAAAPGALRAAVAARLGRRAWKRGDLRVRRWVTSSDDGDPAPSGSCADQHAAGAASGAASACHAYVRCSAVSTPRADVHKPITGACAAVLPGNCPFETPAQGPSSRRPAPPRAGEEQPAPGCDDASSSSRSARPSAGRGGCRGCGAPRGGCGF